VITKVVWQPRSGCQCYLVAPLCHQHRLTASNGH
jgi:hypothetical protein